MEEERNSGIKYTVSNVPYESQNSKEDEFEAVKKIYDVLKNFESNSIKNILDTVITFLGVELVSKPFKITTLSSQDHSRNEVVSNIFSEDRSMSPKEFLFQKHPITDVEKVACLAFYLTHYRDTPFFKTFDISKMNTEAAQIKFSNPAVAVDNATKAGYLVPATKGQKQLSAIGEMFVSSLPDRELAKEAIKNLKPRRKSKSSPKNKD